MSGSLLYCWKNIDTDANNVVTAEEWHAFFEKMKETEGEALYRKAVATMVYENDVNVDDIYDQAVERSTDVRKKMAIATLQTKEIAKLLWDVMDSGASGSLKKKDILFSPLGEILMGHWSELDSSEDGQVTFDEFEQYLNKVKLKDPSGYSSWLVDLIYEADAAGGAMDILTQRMSAKSTEKRMKVAEIALCETKDMLSRMWNTIDVNGDGILSKATEPVLPSIR